MSSDNESGSGNDSIVSDPRVLIAGIAVVVAVAALGYFALAPGSVEEDAIATPGAPVTGEAQKAASTPEAPAAPAQAPMGKPTSPPIVITWGTPLELVAADLPTDRPIYFDFALPGDAQPRQPVESRILSRGRAPHPLQGEAIGADRTTVRLKVDAGLFAPGKFVVEVKTTESSHLPVRRFMIVVN